MQFVNINEKRPEYYFIDSKCIGRRCFHPVFFAKGCENRCNRGCPDPLPEYDKDAAARNKAAGWKLKR